MALWRVLEYAKIKFSRVSIVRTLAGMDGGFLPMQKELRRASRLQADFGSCLVCEPCFCLQHKQKVVRTRHPSQNKTKRTPIWCPLVLAGMDGFEPSKCQSQSLVPYRLATSQYCFSILSHFILVVKHFIKKIIFCSFLFKILLSFRSFYSLFLALFCLQ